MASTKRLTKEYELVLAESSIANSYRDVEMDEHNMLKWTAVMQPNTEPFNTGAYKITIDFSDGYPFKPPKIGFSTKIFHPNVDPDQGKICIGALKETEWKPTTRIVDILIALVNVIEEPNASDPINNDAAELYTRDRSKFNKTAEEWVKKYAEKRR